jgi:hypothetical protein
MEYATSNFKSAQVSQVYSDTQGLIFLGATVGALAFGGIYAAQPMVDILTMKSLP